jgi:hypothetical protein
MRRFRQLVLIALLGFAATPVARVYTAGPPMIDQMQMLFNDLRSLRGEGVPGTLVTVRYRQRNFREGVPGDTSDPFDWCAWKNNGDALTLGAAFVGANGRWALENLDLPILPSVADGSACAGGLRTELLLDSPYGAGSAPVSAWLNVEKPTHQTGTVMGSLEFANRAAIVVADGPDDGDTPFVRDVDEDGVDLCASGIGCGTRVTWKCNGGTFQCPQTAVHDGSSLASTDREYPFVVGMLAGHKPGGSVLMAAEVNRPALGPTLNVDLDIGGLPNCDNKFFDFLN